MERPLKEVLLPQSKYKAKIVTFLTRGEVVRIDSAQWKGAELKYQEGNVIIDKVPVNYREQQEDELLLVGVKELKKDNETIEITKDNLDNLPNEDVKVLLLELRKVQLGKLSKKK